LKSKELMGRTSICPESIIRIREASAPAHIAQLTDLGHIEGRHRHDIGRWAVNRWPAWSWRLQRRPARRCRE
jgi:hypothetical protein